MPEPVPVQLSSGHSRPLPCPRQHPDAQECSSHTSCPRTCARIYSSWECKIKGLRRSEGLILVSATFQQQRRAGAPAHTQTLLLGCFRLGSVCFTGVALGVFAAEAFDSA